MKFTKHWFFGVNSLWAKFCRFIGKERWIHKRPTVTVECCPRWGTNPETAQGGTDLCRNHYGTLVDVEFLKGKEPADCPLNHVVLTERPVCPLTKYKRNHWCPDAIKVLMSDEEWTNLAWCAVHKKPVTPEIPKKVPAVLRVPQIVRELGYPVFASATFIPAYGNIEDKYLDRKKFNEEILDFLCEEAIDNTDRIFFMGNWENNVNKKLSSPYMKTADGKYDLKTWNMAHFDKIKKDIAERAKRFRFSIITLIDNCSTHVNVPGFWSTHPWNGDCNVNGTSSWRPSVYHFYEPEHQDKKGIPESWKRIEEYVRRVVAELYSEFYPLIGFEICNEGQGAHDLHKLIRGWLKEGGVEENWRVLTSFDGVYDEFYKKEMDFLNYSIHGIDSLIGFEEKKKLVLSGHKFLASGDGTKPDYERPRVYKELVYQFLLDGALGFELNERFYWHNKSVFKIADLDKEVMKAVGEGLRRWAQEKL